MIRKTCLNLIHFYLNVKGLTSFIKYKQTFFKLYLFRLSVHNMRNDTLHFTQLLRIKKRQNLDRLNIFMSPPSLLQAF